jgi:hypothetical protein
VLTKNKTIKEALRLIPVVFSVAFLASTANASQVIINTGGGANDSVYGLTSFTLTGEGMAALNSFNVQVIFANNTSVVRPWTSCGAGTGCGFASNGAWTLTETGDTGAVSDIFNPNATALSPWTLINTSTDPNLAIRSVTLLGGPAVTFDRHGPTTGSIQIGTPGSADGVDFTFRAESGANSPWTIAVQYMNLVTINGPSQGPCLTTPPPQFPGNSANGCGDEWGSVLLTFTNSNPFVATAAGPAMFVFVQDTDQVGTPEPMTFGLIGTGLLIMGVYAKRRHARNR